MPIRRPMTSHYNLRDLAKRYFNAADQSELRVMLRILKHRYKVRMCTYTSMRLRSNTPVKTPLQDIEDNFVTPGEESSFVRGDPTPWVVLPVFLSRMSRDSALDLSTRCHAHVIMDKIETKTSRAFPQNELVDMYLDMRDFRLS